MREDNEIVEIMHDNCMEWMIGGIVERAREMMEWGSGVMGRICEEEEDDGD